MDQGEGGRKTIVPKSGGLEFEQNKEETGRTTMIGGEVMQSFAQTNPKASGKYEKAPGEEINNDSPQRVMVDTNLSPD